MNSQPLVRILALGKLHRHPQISRPLSSTIDGTRQEHWKMLNVYNKEFCEICPSSELQQTLTSVASAYFRN